MIGVGMCDIVQIGCQSGIGIGIGMTGGARRVKKEVDRNKAFWREKIGNKKNPGGPGVGKKKRKEMEFGDQRVPRRKRE
jgi:hypothetical protein